ncbi:MAG: transposase [Armatimonadota bacterium]
MPRWHNYYLDNHAHFCTTSVYDFRRLLIGDAVGIIYEEWNRARESFGVRVLAYVVMPEHFHLITWAAHGDSIRAFVSRTLGETSKRLQPGGGFWKERPHVLPLYSQQVLKVKMDYLHRNPLRRELVVNPEDWEHSSFRQLIMGDCAPSFRCDDWGNILL